LKLQEEQKQNANSEASKKLTISYKNLLREFRDMKESKQKTDDMFVELTKDLRKGIKNIHGVKFSGQKFITEADWNLYYEKVLQQNRKFISEDMAEYIAIRNTGAGWVSFKK